MLGLWIEQTEGAKFWPKVMNDLKTRGLQDIPNNLSTTRSSQGCHTCLGYGPLFICPGSDSSEMAGHAR